MDKIIEAKIKGKAPGDITELNLDNCKAAQVSSITDKFVNLETLSLINAGLTTLKGFPKLPNLKLLEMSDNKITNGLESLSGCPNIIHLNLSGNKIADLAALEPLKELKELKTLDLFNCDVTQLDDYRTRVFEMVPGLKYLDGLDKDEKEPEDDDDDDDFEGEAEDDDDDDGDDDEEYVHNSKGPAGQMKPGEYGEDEEDEGDDDLPEEDEEEAEANGSHGTKRKHEEDDDD